MILTRELLSEIYKWKPSELKITGVASSEEINNFFRAIPMFIKELYIPGLEEDGWVCRTIEKQMIRKGSHFRRTKYTLEIDITSKCNLSCPNCIRASHIPGTWVELSYTDILSIHHNIEDAGEVTVKVIGGEPTIHPEFNKIVDYLSEVFPKVIVATNGTMPFDVPPTVAIENSSKEKGVKLDFYAIFNAPIDDMNYFDADYSLGCTMPKHCGTGYTVDGFYPCPLMGTLDRLAHRGQNSAPTLEESERRKHQTMNRLCRLCGAYKSYGYHKNPRPKTVQEETRSLFWEDKLKDK